MLGKNDYLSIYLDDDVIKIAQLELTNSAPKLVNVLKGDLHGLSETDLPKVIQSILGPLNVRRGRAMVVISSNQATTKNIEIPSRDPAEIKSIINLQVGRHTPYSREEILISYVNIGVYQTNYTKVLLVILNRNVVKKQLTLLEKTGLTIDKVLFAPEGMARFYSQALDLPLKDIPVGIIDVGNLWTDFVIEFHGTVIANRSIPIGLKQITAQGQEARDKLVVELSKSIESYQSEDIDKVPTTFILTSDDTYLKELQPVLKEKLNTDIKIVPYLQQLEVAPTALAKMNSEYKGDSFLDVIVSSGVAEQAQVDLMPEEMRLQKSIEEQSREIIKAGIWAVLILILFFAVFFNKLYFKTGFKDKLMEDYSKKRQEAQILQDLSEKTQLVKDYLNSRMVPLELINELYKLLPSGIYLQSVDLDDKGSIIIRGTSESMSLVFSLQTALEASPLFKNIETKSTTSKKEKGKDVAVFEIDFKLKTAKEDKDKETKESSDKNTTAPKEKDASKKPGGQ